MNSSLEQRALHFVKELVTSRAELRSPAFPFAPCDDRLTWISAVTDTPLHGDAEARRALTYGGAPYPPETISELCFESARLSDTLCVVFGAIRATGGQLRLRASFIVEETPDGMKLLHVHTSLGDGLRNQKLQTLMKHIPGGAHQCRNDPNFTLLSMSDSFISMFGYTREEIGTLFHDRFMSMIYPGDRAEVLRTTNQQLQNGTDIELEYRVMPKSGPPIWILDRGRLLTGADGNQCFYCLLIEITDRKREQEALRLSLERHQVIMDQTTDIIFEWDIPRDTLIFSPNWLKKFGYEAIGTGISNRIPFSTNICPDDMTAFLKIMHDTAAGVSYSETEFRIRDVSGRYIWCRIRATAQYDDDRRPVKAVGVIIDIDAEKRQRQALLDQAQRDALTGLYNKSAINTLVEQRMSAVETESLQALMIIDVDNFKAVNDTYGHLSGDSLLSDVAVILKTRTRSSDLVGRIGGDEFLVYLPQISSEEAAAAKAEDLLTALQHLSPVSGAPHITCSIGVALFPRGAIDYFALYKCADQALYSRKGNGRSGVTFYNPANCEGQFPCGTAPSAVNESIVSDESKLADEQFAQYAFRMLYTAADTNAALRLLLEILGRSYDVSRVYIFENSDDGLSCFNTFEWCNENVLPHITVMQHLVYQNGVEDYQSHFNQKGIFYCNDSSLISSLLPPCRIPMDICTMLQCAILDEGKFIGFIGFDDCSETRTWSERRIASFKLTADVLSIFLIKMRLHQRLQTDPPSDLESVIF